MKRTETSKIVTYLNRNGSMNKIFLFEQKWIKFFKRFIILTVLFSIYITITSIYIRMFVCL